MITVSKNKMDDNDFDNLYNSRLLPAMNKLRAEWASQLRSRW